MIRFVAALCAILAVVAAPAWPEPGKTDPDIAEITDLLEKLVTGSANYAETEEMAQNALRLAIQNFGEDSREAAEIHRILVMTAALLGRVDEAERRGLWLARRAQETMGGDDPLLYRIVAAYVTALRLTGKETEALALASEAVAEADRRLPPDSLAGDELRLVQALLAQGLGDVVLADSAFQRLDDRLRGRDDPTAQQLRAMGMVGWADLVADTGDLDRGAELFRAAIGALDAQFAALKNPRMVPMRIAAVASLAETLIKAGRFAEVEPLVRPVMDEIVQVYGPQAPQWGDLAMALAIAIGQDGPQSPRLAEATTLLADTIASWEQVYVPSTVDLLNARLNYAMLLAATGRLDAALAQIDRMEGAALPGSRLQIVYVLHEAELAGQLTRDQAVDGVLHMLQEVQDAGAAAAQRLLAERLAAGSGEAAASLRARTDTRGRLQSLQAQLVALANLPLDTRDTESETVLRQAVSEAQTAYNAAEAVVRDSFPDLAAATGHVTLSLEQIRQRLGPDEALVVIDAPSRAGDSGLIVAVSRDAADWHTFQAEGPEVLAAVASMRRGIDLRLGVRSAASLGGPAQAQGFDFAAAHWLYSQTLGQVEGVIGPKRHLWLDLRGPLAALPPQIMLATPASSDDPGAADWLVRHHSVSVLPAISALRSTAPDPSPTGETLLAFADPSFGALGAQTQLALRGGLAPLPETADEVRDVAQSLGAGGEALRLGAEATEAAVKAAPLDQYGVLYFATHGLVSGDDVGDAALEEPALALTPGGGEDGFLTASEIAELKLNAGLVVLSACNTAVGDKPGAEALSGLAQSFIYAGARSLMVSHWPVDSRSAVALMTDMFARRAADPGLGQAEAQRQAILHMLDAPGRSDWRHPAYWAPFVIVGSGG